MDTSLSYFGYSLAVIKSENSEGTDSSAVALKKWDSSLSVV